MVTREQLRTQITGMIDRMDQTALDMLEAGEPLSLIIEEPSTHKLIVISISLNNSGEPVIPADTDNL